jgi:hypothetical protein
MGKGDLPVFRPRMQKTNTDIAPGIRTTSIREGFGPANTHHKHAKSGRRSAREEGRDILG